MNFNFDFFFYNYPSVSCTCRSFHYDWPSLLFNYRISHSVGEHLHRRIEYSGSLYAVQQDTQSDFNG